MEEITKIHGLAELEVNMTRLADELNKKIVLKAASDAGEVFRRAALANARALFKKKSGRLFRGIIKKVRVKGRGVRGATVNVKVGLRAGRYVPKEKSAWYGRVLETGWVARGRKGGKHIGKLGRRGVRFRLKARRVGFSEAEIRGSIALEFGGTAVAPQPFVLPAFLKEKDRALEVLKQSLEAGISGVKFKFPSRGRSV